MIDLGIQLLVMKVGVVDLLAAYKCRLCAESGFKVELCGELLG